MAALDFDWLRHLRLLLWHRWTEFNETSQEARSQCPLPSLCFSGRSENKIAALDSDWLRHFRLLLWNRRTEFNETWQEARPQHSLPSLCFFFRANRKNKMAAMVSDSLSQIGWDIFHFSSETAQRNSTKLDRKQDLNVFYQICVFGADRKNKLAALASDWLRYFRLLLWNRSTKFNENLTGSKTSTSSTKFVFWGRSEKEDGCPDLWLAETFSTSLLKPLNGIQRNLTGSKNSTSSTKFFGPIG